MKLGLGLYRHMLTPENLRFARQAGATHIVAHLTDYFADGPRIPDARDGGWGVTLPKPPWSVEELTALRELVESEGLTLQALENFDPAFWHDILLDGPRRDEQLETVTQVIRNAGAAGIPVIGYNFSIAGVWGHITGPWARGGAESVGFSAAHGPEQHPLRNGEVWNMTYDPEAPAGDVPPTSDEQLWSRLERFLTVAVPVAEVAGVRLALHPDDPPMETIRGHARLVNRPAKYRRVLDLLPSRSNAIEFCQGTIAEMVPDDLDVYSAISEYAGRDAIGYVHFRNVRGTVPEYHEVFVDEGQVDMQRCLRLYAEAGYDGVFIPDHTPQMTCAAPWHAGMAYALGWMRASLAAIGAI
jgi:mannonate dehydratase